jgi:hypothetical protein
MKNDNKNNKRETWRPTIRLLERDMTRRTVHKNSNKNWRLKMGRISVEIPDQLEKQLRFKTVERFGGKKGDLTRAVEEAIKIWVAKKE